MTGKFPKQCKTAHIIPVYKKGNELDTSNIRPISLCNISKIHEKSLYSRLYWFLYQFNCLYKKQFGFWNSHSTNHALASITVDIRKAFNNDGFACGVFLDLKSFDTVNN